MQPEQLADLISGAIETATAPLHARIQTLERQLAQKSAFPALLVDDAGDLVVIDGVEQKRVGRVRGRDGADPAPVDLDAVAVKVAALMGPAPAGPQGPPGKDADVQALQVLVKAAVVEAVAALPAPKDGRDAVVDLDEVAQKAAALIPAPKDGQNGKDADPVDIDALVQKAVALVPAPVVDVDAIAAKAAALIPTPQNGKDAEVDLAEVARQAAALVPTPKDGRDGKDAAVDAKALADLVAAEVSRAVAALPVPKDGRDGADGADAVVDMKAVGDLVAAEVKQAVAALPVPRDGRDAEPVDLEALAVKAAALVPAPKDGVGFQDVLIDRDGHLVATFTDGRTKQVGRVVGQDGKSVDMDVVREEILAEVAKIPPPKDGRDGYGFDDIGVEFDEAQKALSLVFTKGQERKVFPLPALIDAGIYDVKAAYRKGHVVGRDGSCWVALAEVPPGVVPDGKSELSRKCWRLFVKRGGEGKTGPRGPQGPPGRDRRWDGEDDE